MGGLYYAVHLIRPQNIERGELEIKKIEKKFQDKNGFIIHKNIRNARWNQITDIVQEFELLLMGQLDYGTRRNQNPIPFLEYSNITVTIQNGDRWYDWILMSRRVACTLQSFQSMWITLSFILKVMYVELLL